MLSGLLLLTVTASLSPTVQEADRPSAGLDRAIVEEVIFDVSEGRWPYFIQTMRGLGLAFDITTPYTKIAIAAATAQTDHRRFGVEDVTAEMLTFDVEVTPPPKSSDELIRQTDEDEADQESRFAEPLRDGADLSRRPNVVDAIVLRPDGMKIDRLSFVESKSQGERAAGTGSPTRDSVGGYGTGLKVTLPLEAVQERGKLRVFFSDGTHDDLELDPAWLQLR